jgi:hypothetical protein
MQSDIESAGEALSARWNLDDRAVALYLTPTAEPEWCEGFPAAVEQKPAEIHVFGSLDPILDRSGRRRDAFNHESGKEDLQRDNNDAYEQREKEERTEEAGDL